MELEHFRNSLCNIERKTSAAYTDLCTWKATNTRILVRGRLHLAQPRAWELFLAFPLGT